MGVLVVTEQRRGTVRQAALEVVTAGRELADALSAELTAIVLGPPAIAGGAALMGRYGADRVIVAASDSFGEYAPEGYTHVLAQLIERRGPKVVLFSASARGKDLAPRVAARLKTGLATEVTQIAVDDGRVVVVRPMYAGKVFAKVAFKGEPAMISVRVRSYQAAERPRDPEIEEVPVDFDSAQLSTTVEPLAAEEAKARPDVAEAEIIISGGRGMGGPENWHLLEDLADALGPGSGLGASRAVVDAGWRPHAEQVGQTGKVVSPPLYFAIGISGAIQHQAGMRTAKCIVAVNKDSEAPIFKIADYGIVGDLFEIVPRLAAEIRKLRSED